MEKFNISKPPLMKFEILSDYYKNEGMKMKEGLFQVQGK